MQGTSVDHPSLSAKSAYRVLRATILGLILAAGSLARAAVVQYEFGGVITSSDPAKIGIAPGTPFSGSFLYDTDHSFNGSASGTNFFQFDDYRINPVPIPPKLNVTLGGSSIAAGGGLIAMVSGTSSPLDSTKSQSNVRLHGGNPSYLVDLNFSNPDRLVDPSLALPTTLSLADYPVATLSLNLMDNINLDSGWPISGTITTLTPVPEPTSMAAFACVALGVGWHHRRRRREA